MRLLLLVAVLLCGCATQSRDQTRVLSVKEVNAHASELDGKTIRIRGWLPRCGGRDCSLYESKLDADTFLEGRARVRLLSIGYDPKFDAAVRPNLPATIVLEAQLNADCLNPRMKKSPDGTQYITICADRADDLKPIRLINIQPAAPRGSANSVRN
jgi:hypothetical protein